MFSGRRIMCKEWTVTSLVNYKRAWRSRLNLHIGVNISSDQLGEFFWTLEELSIMTSPSTSFYFSRINPLSS